MSAACFEAPSPKLHAAKISQTDPWNRLLFMKMAERTADPAVLQSKDLMNVKMLQGIYVEERSSSRTLRSSWRKSKMGWLGWALLTVEGVGLSMMVVAKPKKWLEKPTVASEL